MDDLRRLAEEMAGDIDPSVGRGYMPEDTSVEELEHDNESPEAEELDNGSEDSNEQDEAREGDEETSDESKDEESESEEESEESEDEEGSDEESSDDEPSDDVGDLHKVTVDGEEIEVSTQELKDNYAGKQAWDKKFTELSQEREAHQATVETYNGNVKQFQELVNEGKAQEALEFLMETAGLDRNRFLETYVSQLAPTIAEYLEMSPEEREQRALKQQVEHYKAQEQRANETKQQAQQRQEIEGRVSKVLEEHSIEPNRFEELHKELVDAGIKEIQPETVGQYHVMITQQDAAIEVLKELNPELIQDKSAMDYLISLQQNNPGIAKEELKARAEKAFVDALAERVKKDSKATKPRKKGTTKSTKKVGKDILTFDDLENIDPLDLLN
jgi:hypothetical protein